VSVVLAIGFVVGAIYCVSQFEAKNQEIDDLLYKGDRDLDYAALARTSTRGLDDVLKEIEDSRKDLDQLKAVSGIDSITEAANKVKASVLAGGAEPTVDMERFRSITDTFNEAVSNESRARGIMPEDLHNRQDSEQMDVFFAAAQTVGIDVGRADSLEEFQTNLINAITAQATYVPGWKESVNSLNRGIAELEFQKNQSLLEIESAERQLTAVEKEIAAVENEFAAFREKARRMFDEINRRYQEILATYDVRIKAVRELTTRLENDAADIESKLTEIDLDTEDLVAKTGEAIDKNQHVIDLLARNYRHARFQPEYEMVRKGYQGSVVLADNVRGVVAVDVGALDGVASNTVFAVFGTKPDGDPQLKGYIRLDVVTEPHTATGRIMETIAESNPILKGDKIVSPFSPPGAKFVIMERLELDEGREEGYGILPYPKSELARRIRDKGGQIQDDIDVETAFGLVIVTPVREEVTPEEELEQNLLDFLALEEKATSYNVPVIEAKQIIPFLK